MQRVQESYTPVPLTASGLVVGAPGGALGGFLCTTAGSFKLNYASDGTGATIVDTCAVAAGQFVPLPFAIPANAYVYCTLTGGCKGTFAVGQ